MSNTIYLEATGKDCLKIGVCKQADVIWRYENTEVSMDEISAQCRQLAEDLNEISRKGTGGAKAFDELRARGAGLCNELLPLRIKEKLSNSDAEFLILRIDDHLVQIPWELLCINDEFLCQRFNMGRMVKTRQSIVKVRDREMRKVLQMWILANPKGDLAVADSEGEKIFEEMAEMNQEDIIIAPCLDSETGSQEIKDQIINYDFVHFAGHADYDVQNPLQSGWKLSDDKFTVADIDKIAGTSPMPFLIFSNACQSARTEEWDWNEDLGDASFGLPNAFLRAGVKHYIGTSWEVMDEPGSYFAVEFYKLLCSGKTTGQAMRLARSNLTNTYGPDICWASYLLYGDPRVAYLARGKAHKKHVKNRPVAAQNKLTRGAMANYSLNPELFRVISVWLVSFIIMVCVLAYGVILLGNYLRERNEIEREKNKTEQRRAESERRNRIKKILSDRADKQRKRTRDLYAELMKITAQSPTSGTKVSKTLTMAAVFDSQIIKNSKEKMILFAINDQVLESQIPIRLLYRESFDILLEELIRKTELTPSEQRTRPNLLTTKFNLILGVYDSGPVSALLMQLVENETSEILETQFEELDNSRKILEQKKEFTRNILAKLKKLVKSYSSSAD